MRSLCRPASRLDNLYPEVSIVKRQHVVAMRGRYPPIFEFLDLLGIISGEITGLVEVFFRSIQLPNIFFEGLASLVPRNYVPAVGIHRTLTADFEILFLVP